MKLSNLGLVNVLFGASTFQNQEHLNLGLRAQQFSATRREIVQRPYGSASLRFRKFVDVVPFLMAGWLGRPAVFRDHNQRKQNVVFANKNM